MSFRRKAPAAKSLSPAQQLGKMCNGFAGGASFQSHNAMSLLAQLHKQDKAQYNQFIKNATAQVFVPKWAVDAAAEDKVAAVTYKLPLPSHFMDAKDTADDFEPRTFYLEKYVPNAAPPSDKTGNRPRCGHSGLFFAREEVVDNLQAASAELGFTSPFWIRKDHPGLKSGFLQVKEGSESIVISLTASVIGFGDVEVIEEHMLHPLLRGVVNQREASSSSLSVPDDLPLGMNAFTGAVTQNPFVCKMPNQGLWVSQDQLLHYGIKLSRRISQAAGAFSIVEIDQWELFNADQLQVPGRLGLRKSLGPQAQRGVFEPV